MPFSASNLMLFLLQASMATRAFPLIKKACEVRVDARLAQKLNVKTILCASSKFFKTWRPSDSASTRLNAGDSAKTP